MKIYLAGPMSGYPEHNYPEFHRVAANLREMGHFVLNPAELNPTNVTYKQALSVDIAWIIAHADYVWFMRGWEASKGCAVEHALAIACDIPIGYLETDAPGLANDWGVVETLPAAADLLS